MTNGHQGMAHSFWRNKTAVVCGASSGLGRELAYALAAAGTGRLALLARDPGKLEELVETLTEQFTSVQVLSVAVDVLQKQTLQSKAEQIGEQLGPIDLVVQAVGASDRGTIDELTRERLEELLDANLYSSLNCLQCFRPYLRPDRSHVLLIGSLASLFAPRYLGGYALAKHALTALAQQTRLEWGDQGVHVSLACPGPIARKDAGQRYAALASEALPQQALQPGGGAALKGLDPRRLAESLLAATSRKQALIVRPRKVHLLRIVYALSPQLGNWILRRKTS